MQFAMRGNEMGWSAAFASALVAICICDVLYRRIPNALCLSVSLLGFGFWAVHGGADGLLFAAEGFSVGAAAMGGLYLMRVVGAADVKSFAALGASLGPAATLLAGFDGLLAGGLVSLVVVLQHKRMWQRLRPAFFFAHLKQAFDDARQAGTTVPYAVALCAGVLLAMGGLQW